jgi:hypothetical protein
VDARQRDTSLSGVASRRSQGSVDASAIALVEWAAWPRFDAGRDRSDARPPWNGDEDDAGAFGQLPITPIPAFR